MRYNVGDKVRIKSLDWYNENKDEYGYIDCGSRAFFTKMSNWCGKIATIKEICKTNCYHLEEYDFDWTDEMIEGLVEPIDCKKCGLTRMSTRCLFMDNCPHNKQKNIMEEETKVGTALNPIELKSNANCLTRERVDEMSLDKAGQITDFEYEGLVYILPEGYIFKDENGNVINAMKIVLEKKKEVIPNLQLDSIRTVREYDTAHSRIWLEIYEDNPELCIFTHLLVDEDHRRKGYGTKALEQAEIIAKDLGCDTIHLKVETDSWMHEWYLRSEYKFLTNAEDNYTWLTKSI